MTTNEPNKGGFRRPFGLGTFIQEFLSGGVESWGYQIYSAYKKKAESYPLSKRRGGGRRKVCSYATFAHYIWMAREMGLIENVTNDDGSKKEIQPTTHGKKSSTEIYARLQPAVFIRLTSEGASSPDWTNLSVAYREHKF